MNNLSKTLNNPALDREHKYCPNCGKRSFTFAKNCVCGGVFVPVQGRVKGRLELQKHSELSEVVVKDMIIQILEVFRTSQAYTSWEINFLYRITTQKLKRISKGTENKLQELFDKYVLLR